MSWAAEKNALNSVLEMLCKSSAHHYMTQEPVGGVLTGEHSVVVLGERAVRVVAQWELVVVAAAG